MPVAVAAWLIRVHRPPANINTARENKRLVRAVTSLRKSVEALEARIVELEQEVTLVQEERDEAIMQNHTLERENAGLKRQVEVMTGRYTGARRRVYAALADVHGELPPDLD